MEKGDVDEGQGVGKGIGVRVAMVLMVVIGMLVSAQVVIVRLMVVTDL